MNSLFNYFLNFNLIKFPLFKCVAPPSFLFIQAGTTPQMMTNANVVWSWNSIALLTVLAILSLAPVVYKRQMLRSKVAVATQRNAEKHFGVDFELVVGAGDFASKNYFSKDLICKIKRENSIILAFATPR